MPVRGELRGNVFWVVLDRPEKLNALDEAMWRELESRLREGCGSGAPLVALRGEGRAFCTGDDISAMAGLRSADEALEFFDAVEAAVDALDSCSKPVAALVHGYAYGGCAELLLLMAIVVAVRGARIAFPEVRLGLIPPLLTALGPLLLGRRAFALALTGAELGAEEARAAGLVDYVVASPEEGVKLIEGLAGVLARMEPRAVALARRAMRRAVRALASREAFEALKALVLSAAARERMRAFLEKRLR